MRRTTREEPNYVYGSHSDQPNGDEFLEEELSNKGLFDDDDDDDDDDDNDVDIPDERPRAEKGPPPLPAELGYPVNVNFMPLNRHRPVDARWRIAIDLGRRDLDPAPGDDDTPWVGPATVYLKQYLACRTEADCERVAVEFPELEKVRRLKASPDAFARSVLEARLLAGQSDADIAAASGLTSSAVHLYEKLCFAVREALHAKIYIYIHLLGDKHLHGLTEDTPPSSFDERYWV